MCSIETYITTTVVWKCLRPANQKNFSHFQSWVCIRLCLLLHHPIWHHPHRPCEQTNAQSVKISPVFFIFFSFPGFLISKKLKEGEASLSEIQRHQILILHKKWLFERKICTKVSCSKRAFRQAIVKSKNAEIPAKKWNGKAC